MLFGIFIGQGKFQENLDSKVPVNNLAPLVARQSNGTVMNNIT